MPIDIALTFFSDSHDRQGSKVVTSWLNLCARLSNHVIGNKDGLALACATFNGTRASANVATRTMVALDIETSPDGVVPPPFDDVVLALNALRQRAFMWTTWNHENESPRYRVLFPLSRPVVFDRPSDPWFSYNIASHIGLHDCHDPSKGGAASLFYLPRHRDDAPFKVQEIAGVDLDAGHIETSARIISEGVARGEAEVAASRARNALSPEILAIVENYNATHPIVERLLAYGYRRDGTRWKSRYQHNGSQGATTILGESWVSFSESDAHAGIGRRPLNQSSQAACYGDSFALYCFFEHRGSFRAAVESLKEAT